MLQITDFYKQALLHFSGFDYELIRRQFKTASFDYIEKTHCNVGVCTPPPSLSPPPFYAQFLSSNV